MAKRIIDLGGGKYIKKVEGDYIQGKPTAQNSQGGDNYFEYVRGRLINKFESELTEKERKFIFDEE